MQILQLFYDKVAELINILMNFLTIITNWQHETTRHEDNEDTKTTQNDNTKWQHN